MASDKTITINGRIYDAVTGLPVDETAPKPAAAPKVEPKAAAKPVAKPVVKPTPKPVAQRKPATPRTTQSSTAVHSNTTQRAATLSRRVTKKPATPAKSAARTPGQHMDIAPSRQITRFAAHPAIEKKPEVKPAAPVATPRRSVKPVADIKRARVAKAAVKPAAKPVTKPAPKPAPKPKAEAADIPPRVHPTVSRALQKKALKKAPTTKATPATAKQIKDAQIQKALAPTPKPKKRAKKAQKMAWLSKRSRKLLIIAGFVLFTGLVVYGVYRLVPSISVGIAASQSGVNATYPEFTPDGYALKQPVEYADGQVVLTFQSNSNNNTYAITQTRSSWDSSAVLDNVVKPKVGESYVTTKERGLTIYSYDNDATWVSGGVLYTISSSSTLSGHQIRKIATSL